MAPHLKYRTPEEREVQRTRKLAYTRKWRADNPDKVRKHNVSKRLKAGPSLTNARLRAWRAKNPDKAAAQQRRKHLKKSYGITPADFERMVGEQHGRCALCAKTPTRKLTIDHNHATGEVRRLLCHRCNLIVGMFETTPSDILASAVAYVRGDWRLLGVTK